MKEKPLDERAATYADRERTINFFSIQDAEYCAYKKGATEQDLISRTEQKEIDIERIDKYCEENWEQWFKDRGTMKCFKGWLKKIIRD